MGGAIPLVDRAWRCHTWPILASTLAFCLAMTAVYFVSALSHTVLQVRWRRRLRQWDQGLIYLLIVSTYTPMALVLLRGSWHWITALMWILALAGFVSKVALVHRVEQIGVWLYVVIGWLPVFAVPQLLQVAPRSVVIGIVAGGIAYTIGVVVLLFDRRYPYLHTIWHLLVMVGSVCHYVAVTQSLRCSTEFP